MDRRGNASSGRAPATQAGPVTLPARPCGRGPPRSRREQRFQTQQREKTIGHPRDQELPRVPVLPERLLDPHAGPRPSLVLRGRADHADRGLESHRYRRGRPAHVGHRRVPRADARTGTARDALERLRALRPRAVVPAGPSPLVRLVPGQRGRTQRPCPRTLPDPLELSGVFGQGARRRRAVDAASLRREPRGRDPEPPEPVSGRQPLLLRPPDVSLGPPSDLHR